MKKLIVFIILASGFMGSYAQVSTDYGILLGGSVDHNVHFTNLSFSNANPVAGLYYRYNFNPRTALRAGYNSTLSGGHLLGIYEFNFTSLNPNRQTAKFSSYIGPGIGLPILYSAPYINVPKLAFNIGAKYNVSPKFTLALEWSLLGDVKNFILNPNGDNWNSTIGIQIGYKVVKRCKTCPFYETERTKRR
jgi:hypothetical protein